MSYIKSTWVVVLCSILLAPAFWQPVQSQTLRILTVNTASGALTGTALGAAVVALQDNSDIDLYPVQFGMGMGTLMGLGTGIYDMSRSGGQHGYYVQGLISRSGTTGTIILLDTAYGAATGTIVGVAISLMTQSPVVKGMQFGAAAGAWGGFAFGLVDAFVLSGSSGLSSFYDQYSLAPSGPSPASAGLVSFTSSEERYTVHLGEPMMFRSYHMEASSGTLAAKTSMGVHIARMQFRF